MVEMVGKAPAAEGRAYYSITEAAALLGVSRVTLWRWIAAGRLPVWRPGPHTARIRREDLERLVAGKGVDTGRDHFVQFYESDDVLADAVIEHIGGGLRDGGWRSSWSAVRPMRCSSGGRSVR
jgi:excisionase family DNA binding protein